MCRSQIKCGSMAIIFMAVSMTLSSTTVVLSPAQLKIENAQKRITLSPRDYRNYNELAMAYAQRARETHDPEFYDRAITALERSLALEPDNFEAEKIHAWCLLGKHEPAKALELAKKLNERALDDVMVYGLLTDANVELGNYDEAEKAAQWMLDLQPGNIPGLTRAAYLRELFGDIDGSIDLMVRAYQKTPESESEQRAWILTQLAHLYETTGRIEAADQLSQLALVSFPNYHYALAMLAKVRTAQRKHVEAVELLRRHFEVAPHPENLYLLGKSLQRAGRDDQAAAAFRQFEIDARREVEAADNANLDLILYYTEEGGNPDEALRIAEKEIKRRKDVRTRDAYAWALFHNSRYDEAYRQIKAVLKVGVKDAEILYRAGVIAAENGDVPSARRYFTEGINLNPPSIWAENSRLELAELKDI